MTAVQRLFGLLAAHRITVSVHDERLRLTGPRGAISPEVRAAVARNKGPLLEALKADNERGEGITVTPKSPQTVFCDVSPERMPGQSQLESRPAESSLHDRYSVISVTSIETSTEEASASHVTAGDTRDRDGLVVSIALETVTGEMIPAHDLLASSNLKDSCCTCSQARWWVNRRSGRKFCRVCNPPPNPEAEA